MLKTYPKSLLTLLFAVAACSNDVVPLEERTETTLGAEGGQALSAGGELMADFERGTLAAGSVVEIRTDRTDRTLANLVTPVFELSVDPPVERFDPPVTLAITVAGEERTLRVVSVDATTEVAIETSTWDAASMTASARVDRFARGFAAAIAPTTNTSTVSPEDCEADGGFLRWDPGDGSVHRDGCPSGADLVGTVPVGIEGGICCRWNSLTAEECNALNGLLLWDPGDGSVHRNGCPNGARAYGTLPGIEGGLCCPMP